MAERLSRHGNKPPLQPGWFSFSRPVPPNRKHNASHICNFKFLVARLKTVTG